MGLKQVAILEQSKILTSVVEQLSHASSLEEITHIVAQAARALTGADGATFVLKDQDRCYYVDENAVSPLWKGKRFPAHTCISGWSMMNKQVVVIRDIYQDDRIPHDAYLPTFVKSLCMVPIRIEDPIGAIGNYWSQEHVPTPEDLKVLQILANSTAVTLQNLELKQSLQKQSLETEGFRDRAQELEAAICSVAHDLRSPVAAMMGLSELLYLNLQSSENETIKLYLQSLLETGRQATDQIVKMLSLYKITQAKMEFRKLDISKMTQSILMSLKDQMKVPPIESQIENGLSAYGDETLVKLVLENLLSNALKYSSKKPQITIQVGSLPGVNSMEQFFVKDNGQGFPPEKSHLLFRPLNRLHSEKEFPGTGLGLASVARIIERHGGSVKAESNPPNGSTFYFSLPQVLNS